MPGIMPPQHRSAAWLRQLSTTLLLTILVSVSLFTTSLAQPIDTQAPVIEVEELKDSPVDLSQVFTALIAEDVQLKDATLYYRREGQQAFSALPMEPLGTTGYFSVSVPTPVSDLRAIEYYVQARDEAGNRTVSGFAFDPYRRTLHASAASLAQQTNPSIGSATTESTDTTPLLKQRWVQVTLGILALSALATLADDDGADSQVVPLTFSTE